MEQVDEIKAMIAAICNAMGECPQDTGLSALVHIAVKTCQHDDRIALENLLAYVERVWKALK